MASKILLIVGRLSGFMNKKVTKVLQEFHISVSLIYMEL